MGFHSEVLCYECKIVVTGFLEGVKTGRISSGWKVATLGGLPIDELRRVVSSPELALFVFGSKLGYWRIFWFCHYTSIVPVMDDPPPLEYFRAGDAVCGTALQAVLHRLKGCATGGLCHGRPVPRAPQSHRSAIIGSTLVARWAGT
jgi:hypothetical protein